MRIKQFFSTMALLLSTPAWAQVMPLYPTEIPNSRPAANQENTLVNEDGVRIVREISVPTLEAFIPHAGKASGTAVIICPGGGYWVNAIGLEGRDIAKAFQKKGVAAFVLKYRIPDSRTMIQPETGPLQDAQQAIRLVRTRAAAWYINPQHIGILGFSAGGHLASTAGTHFNIPVIDNPGNISLRPDFMMLIYPVISLVDSVGHSGSRTKLLGQHATADKIREYSSELQVTSQTPPTFLVHASDDDGVPPFHSIVFYQQLRAHGVNAELHIYQGGGHGFGMNNKTTADRWMDRGFAWLQTNGWLK